MQFLIHSGVIFELINSSSKIKSYSSPRIESCSIESIIESCSIESIIESYFIDSIIKSYSSIVLNIVRLI